VKKTSSFEILRLAKELSEAKVDWHFHILAPGCVFNKNKRFALILEDKLAQVEYVNHTTSNPTKLGKELILLLGRKRVDKKRVQKKGKKVPAKVEQMLRQAKALNLKGFAWHYHLLYPECIFNHDKRYWKLVFEDPVNEKIVEEMFDILPKRELELIENLFYSTQDEKFKVI
jgi:hypothetical protein